MRTLAIWALLFAQGGEGTEVRKPSNRCGAATSTNAFGLEVGRRWTYAENGRAVAELDVEEGAVIDGVSTLLLRGRGPLELLGGAFYASWRANDGLMVHAERAEDRPVRGDAPSLLIPDVVAAGKRRAGLFWEVETTGREQVTTDAGTFDAWRLHYRMPEAFPPPHSRFTIWVAPGTGVVRIASSRSERTLDLMSVEQRCLDAPPTSSTEAVEVRLHDAPQVVEVGDDIRFEFRMHNVGAKPVYVVTHADGSDLGERLPRFDLEVRDDRGRRMRIERDWCGFSSRLEDASVRLLLPGESVDAYGVFDYMRRWTPRRPGRYSVRLTYRTVGDEASWTASGGPPTTAAAALLEHVPRGVWATARHEFRVVERATPKNETPRRP